jgi:hypothetical protein
LLGSLPLHRCGAPGAVNIMANWQDSSIAEYRSARTGEIRAVDAPRAAKATLMFSKFDLLGGCFMNDDFLRERARAVRAIAEKADPFTKKRLLKLAERYEGGAGRPSRTPIPAPDLLADKVERLADEPRTIMAPVAGSGATETLTAPSRAPPLVGRRITQSLLYRTVLPPEMGLGIGENS